MEVRLEGKGLCLAGFRVGLGFANVITIAGERLQRLLQFCFFPDNAGLHNRVAQNPVVSGAKDPRRHLDDHEVEQPRR
ncbi:hypothetical protein ACLB2K_029939 [Fragaria x ananassa]